MEKKYYLSDNSDDMVQVVLPTGVVVLKRIVAAKTFRSSYGMVKAGNKGGYIQSEKNLSHEGACWVFDEGMVYGDAKVYGDAYVSNDACVHQSAVIKDKSNVINQAIVAGGAIISGKASVMRYAQVIDNAQVTDSACITDNARISGKSIILGESEIGGMTRISGNSIVAGDTQLYSGSLNNVVMCDQEVVKDGEEPKEQPCCKDCANCPNCQPGEEE